MGPSEGKRPDCQTLGGSTSQNGNGGLFETAVQIPGNSRSGSGESAIDDDALHKRLMWSLGIYGGGARKNETFATTIADRRSIHNQINGVRTG